MSEILWLFQGVNKSFYKTIMLINSFIFYHFYPQWIIWNEKAHQEGTTTTTTTTAMSSHPGPLFDIIILTVWDFIKDKKVSFYSTKLNYRAWNIARPFRKVYLFKFDFEAFLKWNCINKVLKAIRKGVPKIWILISIGIIIIQMIVFDSLGHPFGSC